MFLAAPAHVQAATPRPASSTPPADASFLPQFRGPGLPDGLPWGPDNGNCGPASVVNALRLVGLDVPGFAGERSQAAIDAARLLMTGENDPTRATTKQQQADAMRAVGAVVDATHSFAAALEAVRDGAVLLLGGNRAAAGWPRRPDDAPPTGVAAHAVVVARHEPAQDRYVVYDPALAAPVTVDAGQLLAFTQASDGDRMLRPGLVTRGAG